MDALSVNPVAPATFATLAALRPLPTVAAPSAPDSSLPGASAAALRDLAQTAFQRTLQAATLYPLVESSSVNPGLFQNATASLLASLTTPAPVETPAVATIAAPSSVQPTDNTTSSTAPPSAPPLADLPGPASPQDAFATSLSPDFAAQTALRFGAGVGTQAALTALSGDFGAELVRDATRVLRTENLQPRSGGPGPEAYAQTQNAIQRVLRTYETGATPAATGSSAVDLLA